MEIDEWQGAASTVPPVQAAPRGDDEPQLDGPPAPDPKTTYRRLGALILALEEGRIRFGAAKTRGLGHLKLTGTSVREDAIGNRAGLLRRLRMGERHCQPNIRDALVQAADAAGRDDAIEIIIDWRPVLPVMNKSAAEGVSIDALPLVTGNSDQLQPVITGASVKGVLRSHAERICRTLGGMKADTPSAAVAGSNQLRQDFLDDLAECELVETVFGVRGMGRKADEKYEDVRTDGRIPGLGALSVDDCPIEKPVSRGAWQELLTVSGEEDKTVAVRHALEKSAWRDFRPATHVAIDRWTGGAAESLLFSRLEPATGGRHEFHLWLDFERFAKRSGKEVDAAFRQAAFALILVTLREFALGRVPIGYATTRGLGSIEVDRIVFDGLTIDESQGMAGGGTEIAIARTDFDDAAQMEPFREIEKAWQHYWSSLQARAG
jgi:CRISPR/Cas system CSM-associated protein Csm3 (group 7 of RAMP superfamily)